MHRIEYELSERDFFEFNMRYLRTSSLGRRQLRVFRMLLSWLVTVVTAGVLLVLTDHLVTAAVTGLLSAVVMWFWAPGLWEREVTKNLRRLASDRGLGTVGPHTLTLHDDGVHEETASSRTATPWSAIDKLDETEEYAFIFFAPTQAFVVPKRVPGAEVFLSELRARLDS